MVAEAWIVKMGNQVSTNIKHALLLENSTTKKKHHNKRLEPKLVIGILSFEVSNIMSKIIHLYKSLSDSEISKLKTEILESEGIKNLVSSDDTYLLDLAVAEKLDELNRVSTIVSRLGKKCSEPALQGFEHVYGDVLNGIIDVKELGFLVKDMEGMLRKMERYVNATSNLYCEMEVLNELEQATRKFQLNQHEESRRALEQKLVWQKQDVRHLRDISLWNQTYDKVVEMLARTVCTVFARICVVSEDSALKNDGVGLTGERSPLTKEAFSGHIRQNHDPQAVSRPLKRVLSKNFSGYQSNRVIDSQRGELEMFRAADMHFPCGTNPGRFFTECLRFSSSNLNLDDDDDYGVDRDDQSSQISSCCSVANATLAKEHTGFRKQAQLNLPLNKDPRHLSNGAMKFGHKSKLALYAIPSTVGGSALSLHYANVIIVIEKLLHYPHLVGDEARDDLYQMLPTSLRMSLKANLKSYINNFAIYDAPLAHDWKDTLDGLLKWLAPLAHNMIRWQSERNFEQQQIVKRTNVLLLQTLYFADRDKTEAAICKLLAGLNYICRYEQQQNALLDCASSFDFEDCMQWQMQCQASCLNS